MVYMGDGLCQRHWLAKCAAQERTNGIGPARGEPAGDRDLGPVSAGPYTSVAGESPQPGMWRT